MKYYPWNDLRNTQMWKMCVQQISGCIRQYSGTVRCEQKDWNKFRYTRLVHRLIQFSNSTLNKSIMERVFWLSTVYRLLSVIFYVSTICFINFLCLSFLVSRRKNDALFPIPRKDIVCILTISGVGGICNTSRYSPTP